MRDTPPDDQLLRTASELRRASRDYSDISSRTDRAFSTATTTATDYLSNGVKGDVQVPFYRQWMAWYDAHTSLAGGADEYALALNRAAARLENQYDAQASDYQAWQNAQKQKSAVPSPA